MDNSTTYLSTIEIDQWYVLYNWLMYSGTGGYSYDFDSFAYDFTKIEIFSISYAIVNYKSNPYMRHISCNVRCSTMSNY